METENTSAAEARSAPGRSLSVADGVAMLAGIVIGAGIFRTPSNVAGNVSGAAAYLLVWVAGGWVSLIGALCYAELAVAYPDAGGDYHFLTRAYGSTVGFLFAWARMTVIQTGSIALHAFLIGDYASQVFPLGPHASSVYAAGVVILLTLLNLAGLKVGKSAQNMLTTCVLAGLLTVIVVGLIGAARGGATAVTTNVSPAAFNFGNIGFAMVYVLLTYGGWNEAAYLSAEVRGGRRAIVGVFLWGIGLVTAVYLLVNLAYLSGLGVAGLAASNAVAADLVRGTAGELGARCISLIIVVAALGSTNGTILTSARTNYALGRDFPVFAAMGRWHARTNTPRAAFVMQGSLTLVLIGLADVLGKRDSSGFESMVRFTAPVFWLFFMLAGMSLIVLRQRDSQRQRLFRVPFYPATPLLFCAVCAYMLWSGIQYAGIWAWIGVGILTAGVPLALHARSKSN